jgi:hypothetical protein
VIRLRLVMAEDRHALASIALDVLLLKVMMMAE